MAGGREGVAATPSPSLTLFSLPREAVTSEQRHSLCCASVLNNFPTCHAACCPVSHVAAGNGVAKTITADVVTLSWHLLPHLFPTLPMGSPAISHPPPPLTLSNLVSGTWRSGQPASRGGTDTRGISPTLPSLPSGPNQYHPPAHQVQNSPICGRF